MKMRSIIQLKTARSAAAFFASALVAFGIYNIHAQSGITEGGILGLTLLLERWFYISPAYSSFLCNSLCYFIGWRSMGLPFVGYSLSAAAGYSLCYYICEQFPPFWPSISAHPLWAALLGAVFIGVGTGVCVRAGGAASGDDALAMTLTNITHISIEWIYLFSDLTVLCLSLTYIPFHRIVYSLLTVILSGQIIGWIQKIKYS